MNAPILWRSSTSARKRKEIDKDRVQRPVEQTRGTKLNLMMKMGERDYEDIKINMIRTAIPHTEDDDDDDDEEDHVTALISLTSLQTTNRTAFKVYQLTLQHKASICAMIALNH